MEGKTNGNELIQVHLENRCKSGGDGGGEYLHGCLCESLCSTL